MCRCSWHTTSAPAAAADTTMSQFWQMYMRLPPGSRSVLRGTPNCLPGLLGCSMAGTAEPPVLSVRRLRAAPASCHQRTGVRTDCAAMQLPPPGGVRGSTQPDAAHLSQKRPTAEPASRRSRFSSSPYSDTISSDSGYSFIRMSATAVRRGITSQLGARRACMRARAPTKPCTPARLTRKLPGPPGPPRQGVGGQHGVPGACWRPAVAQGAVQVEGQVQGEARGASLVLGLEVEDALLAAAAALAVVPAEVIYAVPGAAYEPGGLVVALHAGAAAAARRRLTGRGRACRSRGRSGARPPPAWPCAPGAAGPPA